MAWAIGIDVGGTKTAAGVVDLDNGGVHLRRQQPTGASRPGETVLSEIFTLVESILAEARANGLNPATIGVGIAELVSPSGEVVSDATIRWKGRPIQKRFEKLLPTVVEADVRAAARAESKWGAGSGLSSFLFVTIGTGISASLVVEGRPYTGARGLTGTFASARGLIPSNDGMLSTGPALEHFASGSALASRYRRLKPDSSAEAPDVLSLADAGDSTALEIVRTGGLALGAAIADLVNILDPEAVVLGGGLGLAACRKQKSDLKTPTDAGAFGNALMEGFRAHLWSSLHANIPVCPATLGADAGLIGAALASGMRE